MYNPYHYTSRHPTKSGGTTWCIYITSNKETDQFYIGKANLFYIERKIYVGSGKLLRKTIVQMYKSSGLEHKSPYSPAGPVWLAEAARLCGWKTDPIEYFNNQHEAYLAETSLTKELNILDGCLNLTCKIK